MVTSAELVLKSIPEIAESNLESVETNIFVCVRATFASSASPMDVEEPVVGVDETL